MAKKATRTAAKTVRKKAAKTSAKKSATKAAKKSKTAAKTSGKKAARRPAKKMAKVKSPVRAKKASTRSAPKPLTKSPLTKAQLKQFRELLLAKRRDLIGDMNGIEAEAFRGGGQHGGSDLSNMPTHPADIGTDNYEHEFSLGLLESERTLLKEINDALERVDGDMFGVCLGTGQAIGLPRLKARPWAKYSIEYARMLEKGLVHLDEDQDDLDDDSDDDSLDD